MYRITNNSNRSFVVSADDVVKGGIAGALKNEKIIIPGKGIVEVSDKLGKALATYSGVDVVEIVKANKGK